MVVQSNTLVFANNIVAWYVAMRSKVIVTNVAQNIIVSGCHNIRDEENKLICYMHTNIGEGMLLLQEGSDIRKDIIRRFVDGGDLYDSIKRF